MQKLQNLVDEYLLPNVYRKSGEPRQQMVQLLEDAQAREYYIKRAIKYLLETCNSWDLCYKEFALLFDPFQSTRSVKLDFLYGRSDLRRALKAKIEQLGWPEGSDISRLEYCLSIVGIRVREEKKGTKIEVEYRGWGPFKRRVEIPRESFYSVSRTMAEIMRDLG